MGKSSADYGSKLHNHKSAQHKTRLPAEWYCPPHTPSNSHDVLEMSGPSGYYLRARAVHAELDSTGRNGSMSPDHQHPQKGGNQRAFPQCDMAIATVRVHTSKGSRATYSDRLRCAFS